MAQDKDKKVNRGKQMRKRMAKRSRALFLAFAVGVSCVMGSVIFTVAAHGDEYSKIVLRQQTSSDSTREGLRGNITDRNGTVLASSNRIYTLILDPHVMGKNSEESQEATIQALKKYFDIDPSVVRKNLEEKPESKYIRLRKEIPATEYDDFQAELKEREEDDKLPEFAGVWFEEGFQRNYPFNKLAADVIGFATETNGGETGLEKQYDDVLTGVAGFNVSYVGEGAESKNDVYDASDGYNIVTTIDFGVQDILEKKLGEYNDQKRSANTAAIVYDPNSGEILGMASWPFYDLNDPRNMEATEKLSADEKEGKTDAELLYQLWSNFCVSRSYEPGSTFKSVTVASALEEGKTHDGDEFYCPGYKEVEGVNVHCWMGSYGGHGTLDLEEALGDSCNVSLMELGNRLGAKRMVENQYAFGFGTRTGVDLPEESRGVLKDPEEMTELDIASNSFGQNLEVNMVQMVAAYGAIVNGGNYYQPHIVKAFTDSEGRTVKTIAPTVVRKPVTKETSEHIKQYLKAGVEEYAVQYSKVEGYSMGGKTATAQKHPRSEKKWLVSVMSFAPVENPQFILYVLIDEPEGTTGGDGDGMDSQTLTQDIMEDLLPYMGVKATEMADKDKDSGYDDQSYYGTSGETGVDTPEYESEGDDYGDPERDQSGEYTETEDLEDDHSVDADADQTAEDEAETGDNYGKESDETVYYKDEE